MATGYGTSEVYGAAESFDLDPDLKRFGQTKSDQAEMLQRRENSGFVITVRRSFEVHGFLDGESSSRASLLVLQLQLSNENRSRTSRFKLFQPIFRVERSPKKDAVDDPVILSFGPCQKGSITLSESSAKLTETTGVEGNAAAQLPSTSIGGKVTYSRNWERQRPFYYKVSGNSSKSPLSGSRLGEDVVQWTMEEDSNTKVGVGDEITIFIFLKRPDNANFVLNLETRVKINSKVWLTEKFRKIKDLTRLQEGVDYNDEDFDGYRYKPLRFDVTKSPTAVPANIDRLRLSGASAKNLFDPLAYLHVPEAVRPKQVYQAESQEPSASSPKNLTTARDEPQSNQTSSALATSSLDQDKRKRGQQDQLDDFLSDGGDVDDLLSEDEHMPPWIPKHDAFSTSQLEYVHSLIAACSLYYRSQQVLFRECNRLRKLERVTPATARATKELLSRVKGQIALADTQIKPFARTRNVILHQEPKVKPSEDIDRLVFPVPFEGAWEDPTRGP